jgi:hypothetical protein
VLQLRRRWAMNSEITMLCTAPTPAPSTEHRHGYAVDEQGRGRFGADHVDHQQRGDSHEDHAHRIVAQDHQLNGELRGQRDGQNRPDRGIESEDQSGQRNANAGAYAALQPAGYPRIGASTGHCCDCAEAGPVPVPSPTR